MKNVVTFRYFNITQLTQLTKQIKAIRSILREILLTYLPIITVLYIL